jgi:hypothetical protein
MNQPSEIPKKQAEYSARETITELILSLPPIIRAGIFEQARKQASEGDEIAEGWLEEYGHLESVDSDEAN